MVIICQISKSPPTLNASAGRQASPPTPEERGLRNPNHKSLTNDAIIKHPCFPIAPAGMPLKTTFRVRRGRQTLWLQASPPTHEGRGLRNPNHKSLSDDAISSIPASLSLRRACQIKTTFRVRRGRQTLWLQASPRTPEERGHRNRNHKSLKMMQYQASLLPYSSGGHATQEHIPRQTRTSDAMAPDSDYRLPAASRSSI